jgi:dipeptidase E
MDTGKFIHTGMKFGLRPASTCRSNADLVRPKERRMQTSQVILSIGGGGFTHATDPELDDFCLGFVRPRANIGYIGWANGDDETRIARFYARFEQLAGSLSHLPLGSTGADTRDWLEGKDLVYLAGGNTAHLIAAILAKQALPAFLSANKAGCVIAGVSAGGACWFDWILSDSSGMGYQPLAGLSVISGGVCPHFSSEPARRSILERKVSDRPSELAFAIDDGACLVSLAGKARGYFSARTGRAAYEVTRRDDAPVVMTERMIPFSR